MSQPETPQPGQNPGSKKTSSGLEENVAGQLTGRRLAEPDMRLWRGLGNGLCGFPPLFLCSRMGEGFRLQNRACENGFIPNEAGRTTCEKKANPRA